MVAVRMTTHPAVEPDCPVCGLPLPQIVVDVDVRADGPGTLWVECEAQELDAAWWAEARAKHPGCVP